MKVVIDQDGCIGCGLCVNTCPEVFEMNDDNIAEVYKQPTEVTDEVQEAVDGCPVQVISIED